MAESNYNKKNTADRPLWLVTGGAGFIGSAFVLKNRAADRATILNLDALTYSGNILNLKSLETDPEHIFVPGDIGDKKLVASLLREHKPSAIINFAAETHVDRSILDPEPFVKTNIQGTCALLAEALLFWRELPEIRKNNFRFLHISTDEVFGTLEADGPPFTEESPYAPNSPYSASKASSDHFVRAFHHTYGLPTIITNCSNNYGPRQFPEKLIPLMILNALAWKPLPIYGQGQNIRDWLHVEDHCAAVRLVLEGAAPGQTYNIGGRAEKNNLEVVRQLCSALDQLHPHQNGSYEQLISFVADRPGHDFRYAVNADKIKKELGWKATHNFERGLRETIKWYLDNPGWVDTVQSGRYRDWLKNNYEYRDGLT